MNRVSVPAGECGPVGGHPARGAGGLRGSHGQRPAGAVRQGAGLGGALAPLMTRLFSQLRLCCWPLRTLNISGAALALLRVGSSAKVTVSHGRRDRASGPSPASAPRHHDV